MNATQQPRVQLGLDNYHDLITFQAHGLLQSQIALAAKDDQIKQLAQQLADEKAKAQQPAVPVETIVKVLQYFQSGEPMATADLEPLKLYAAKAMLRGAGA